MRQIQKLIRRHATADEPSAAGDVSFETPVTALVALLQDIDAVLNEANKASF